MADLPYLIEPGVLHAALGEQPDDLLVVDLCRAEVYATGHLPTAVHLDYAALVAARPPVGGLLPDLEVLGMALGAAGVRPGTHVVAYDDEGGGKAGRLLWTLDAIGHPHRSLLDGGLHAWVGDGLALSAQPLRPAPERYPVSLAGAAVADKDYILARIGAPDVALLDTRSPEEYRGENVRAARGGHIPGAVNMDWVLAMDPARAMRLRGDPELRALLGERGVTPDKEVIVYCQTHHRSSHTYAMLKSLDYPRVRGYPGAWSEWGNLPDTPVER